MTTEDIFSQYIAPIIAAYFVAWFVHRISGWIARRMIGLTGYVPPSMQVRKGRQRTLNDLLGSAISFIAFLIATIVTLGLFIDTTTLVWMLGLFSAAFGLGARPIISDYLTGMTFIFGDVFDVGDKVEIMGIEGTIEKISLNMVAIRSTHGELYQLPNGEVRVVRNFSRGRFSSADVTVKVDSADMDATLTILKQLSDESQDLFTDVLEPLQLLNTTGAIGQQVELTLIAKVHFGKAPEVRLQLLSEIYKRISAAGIHLADL